MGGASLCKGLNFVSSGSVFGLRKKSLVGCGWVAQGFEVWFEVCLRSSSLVCVKFGVGVGLWPCWSLSSGLGE